MTATGLIKGKTKKEYLYEYRQKNKTKLNQSAREYYQLPKVKQSKKEYCQKPEIKEHRKKYLKKYRQNNKERFQTYYHKNKYKYWKQNYTQEEWNEHRKHKKEYWKKYYLKNKERLLKRTRENHILNKEINNARSIKYLHEHREQLREASKKWRKTENGRKSGSKAKHKHRGKGWIQILPNIFPKDIPVDFHHLDGKIFVAPLPANIHRKVGGKNLPKHLSFCNDWIEFYYNIHPDKFLMDKKGGI